jgi:hypothetical protein
VGADDAAEMTKKWISDRSALLLRAYDAVLADKSERQQDGGQDVKFRWENVFIKRLLEFERNVLSGYIANPLRP